MDIYTYVSRVNPFRTVIDQNEHNVVEPAGEFEYEKCAKADHQFSSVQTVYNTKGTRAHAHRKLI